MKLRLVLHRYPPAQGGDLSRDVVGRLTLGRGSDNDWVLQDEERLLSKNHCVIEFKGGLYMVTDTSTNGVFINDGPQPVGRGNTCVLHDGDRLSLGGYAMRANFAEDRPAASDSSDPFLAVLRDGAETSPSPPPLLLPDDDDPFDRAPSGRPVMNVAPIPHDDDLFGDSPRGARDEWSAEPWRLPPSPDDAPAEQAAMRIGKPIKGAIPDDWDEGDELAPPGPEPDFAAPFPATDFTPAPAFAPVPVPAATALPDDWDDEEPLSAPPAFGARPAAPLTPPEPGGAGDLRAVTRALVAALLAADRARETQALALGALPSGTGGPAAALRQAIGPEDALDRLLVLGAPGAEAAVRVLAESMNGHILALFAAARETSGPRFDEVYDRYLAAFAADAKSRSGLDGA